MWEISAWSVTPSMGVLELSAYIWGVRLTSMVSSCALALASSCRLYTGVLSFAVLRGDSESQGHPATTRAPGPVWALGAHLRRQPVSGRGMGRGKEGVPWLLPVHGARSRRESGSYSESAG